MSSNYRHQKNDRIFKLLVVNVGNMVKNSPVCKGQISLSSGDHEKSYNNIVLIMLYFLLATCKPISTSDDMENHNGRRRCKLICISTLNSIKLAAVTTSKL